MQKYFIHCLLLILYFTLLMLTGGCALLLSTEEHHLVNDLNADTRQTMERVQIETENRPDSALRETITSLDSILAYTDTIRTNPFRFNKATIDDYALKIKIINENIDRIDDLTLATDISFLLGTYKMEDIAWVAQKRLKQLARTVAEAIIILGRQYPDHQINLIIKTVGFTDESEVLANTQLAKKIMSELESHEIKKSGEEQHRVFNRMLSEYRAEGINIYLAQQVKARVESKQKFSIEPIIIGKGEQLPGSKDKKQFKNIDSNRRICIVSPFIEVVP